jgi:lipid-binding SYLF domain-containing protein
MHMRAHRFGLITCNALAFAAVLSTTATAQEEKLEDRAKSAAKVLANLVSDPKNSPPNKLLRSATCIAIIPSVKTAAFVVGGQVGFGLASCRVGDGWSLPTYISLKAGSVGFQVGGSATDVALIFTHDDAPQLIAGSNFQIGGQASVAAGPVGSTIGANTDFKKGSSIYSYPTRGAGLFAGVSLAGSDVRVDNKGNRTAYPEGSVKVTSDKSPDVAALLATRADTKTTPAMVQPFTEALEKRIGGTR